MVKKVLLLGGTIDPDALDINRAKAFAVSLGMKLSNTDYTILYCGNKDDLAEITINTLTSIISPEQIKKRIITYIPRSRIRKDPYDNKPINQVGTVIIAGDWSEERRERIVRDSNLIISIAGRRGTYQCLSLAAMLNIPMVIIPQFGGSSQKYFDTYYDSIMKADNHEIISLTTSLNDISLHEDLLAEQCIAIIDLILKKSDEHSCPFRDEYQKLFDISLPYKAGFSDVFEEVERMKKTDDAVLILTATRRSLESVISKLTIKFLDRQRNTEPLRSLIDKLKRTDKIPEDVIAQMIIVNDLGNMGTHPKKIKDPNEVIKMAIIGLTIILEWFFESI